MFHIRILPAVTVLVPPGSPLQAQEGEDTRGNEDNTGDDVHPANLMGVEPSAENAEDAHQEQPPERRPRNTPRIRALEDMTLPLTPASPNPAKTAAKEKMVMGLVRVRKKVDEYIPANFLRDFG